MAPESSQVQSCSVEPRALNPCDANAASAELENPVRLTLATIVVNYRTADLTIECLRSCIDAHRGIPDAQVIVVDNCSGDGSDDVIEAAIEENSWDDRVRLTRSPVNGGFSAGNNVALKEVDADLYLLLNSDTLVYDGAIETLIRVLEQRPDVGLIGPRIEWPDGAPQNTCYRFRTPITEFLVGAKTDVFTRMFPRHVAAMPVPEQECEPDWTSFACCLIRREVIDQVGLLDEGYFMYFDDIDYCRRARDIGWKVLHYPSARIIHLRGQSGPVKKLAAERKRRPAYFYHSRNRYFAKFHGRFGMWLANIGWHAGRAVSLIREALRTKQPHTCEREWLDIWKNGWSPMSPPHLRDEGDS